ncbi:MAG TPA: hypothetical protein VD788_06045 [Candidatus Polarisedimenticolaceae bacterium]|nr:hypothetical protein [Candidatus Polarisedimenticolaceae bacterium]
MKKVTATLIAALALGATAGAGELVERRTIRDAMAVAGDGRTGELVVDNVFGSIRVETHDRPLIEYVAHETIEARDRDAVDRAREEVRLDVRREGDSYTLFVDGPFRCDDDRRCHCGRETDYVVVYDFEIRVPRRIDVDLRTVNGGEIEVTGVRGDYRVANVNGGVRLLHVDGSGRANTVNGPIRVVFDGNPRAESEFRTVNGDVDLEFQPDLSADVRAKTFNGEIWTDFDAEPLPLDAPQTARRDGKTVIRTDRWAALRIAGGGPLLTFETLNGDILIRNALR